MHEQARARLERMPELDAEVLARLARTWVAIVGCGALGGWAMPHLAMLGIGLILVDHDAVSPENLANQAFAAADVGKPKAFLRAKRAQRLNPECRVRVHVERIENLGSAALSDASLILTGVDNIGARLRIAELSTAHGVPVVDAGVDGTGATSFGYVSFYAAGPSSPCLACGLAGPAFARAVTAEHPREKCPSWRSPAQVLTAPTLSSSSFAAIVAGFEASWAVRALTGHAGELDGRRMFISATGEPRVRIATLSRNPACALGHARLEPLLRPGTPTVGATLRAASRALEAPVDSLAFRNRALAIGLVCPGCGARVETVRIATSISDTEARCAACGDRELQPVALRSSLGASEMAPLAEWTWSELGVPALDVVTARAGARAVHVVVNTDSAERGQ